MSSLSQSKHAGCLCLWQRGAGLGSCGRPSQSFLPACSALTGANYCKGHLNHLDSSLAYSPFTHKKASPPSPSTRSAYLISSKCLGHKAPMTINLSKALKSFQQRQARYLPSGEHRRVAGGPGVG